MLLGAVAVIAAAPSLLPLAGYRPLVVLSGSMAPALMPGDAIVTRIVRPSDLRVGDVVTFTDTTRGNALITHRVTEVRHEADVFSFVTRGDRNAGVERWTVHEQDRVGRLALSIPKLGFVVSWMSAPGTRALLLGLPLLLLAAVTLRRIWA